MISKIKTIIDKHLKSQQSKRKNEALTFSNKLAWLEEKWTTNTGYVFSTSSCIKYHFVNFYHCCKNPKLLLN